MPGVVVFFGSIDDTIPGCRKSRRTWVYSKCVRNRFAPGKCIDQLDRCGDCLLATRLDHVVNAASFRVGHDLRSAFKNTGEQAHVIGMICHHQEIQGPGKSCFIAAGRSDFVAACKLVSIFGSETVAEGASVKGKGGVQVRITPVNVIREIAVRVRRVRGFFKNLGIGRSAEILCSQGSDAKYRRNNTKRLDAKSAI